MAAEYFSSDFEPFGVFAFSNAEPVTRNVYEGLRDQLGSAFQQPSQNAETFADAMCLGIAQLQIDSAAAQGDPNQVNYMLAEVEKDFRLVPKWGATLEQRRAALETAMTASCGAITSVVFAGLTAILGSDFIYWRPMDRATEVTLSTASPVFVSPRTPIKLVNILTLIMPGSRVVEYSRVLDDGNPLLNGERITIDPAKSGLDELVTVTEATPTTFRATFAKPHGANTEASTAPLTRWCSTAAHSMVVVSAATLSNPEKLAEIHAFMRKVLKTSNTWCICAESGTGVVGPFTVSGGRVGQTPIGNSAIATVI